MPAAFRLSRCYKFQAYYGAACSLSSNRRRSVEFSPVLHAGNVTSKWPLLYLSEEYGRACGHQIRGSSF